jgi:hypothetical protein
MFCFRDLENLDLLNRCIASFYALTDERYLASRMVNFLSVIVWQSCVPVDILNLDYELPLLSCPYIIICFL